MRNVNSFITRNCCVFFIEIKKKFLDMYSAIYPIFFVSKGICEQDPQANIWPEK